MKDKELEKLSKNELLELMLYLRKEYDKLNAENEKLICANGMIYAIPNENTNDTVQYQLQIAAQYQI